MGARHFGIFDHMERRDGETVAQLFESRLQLLEFADRSGFYAYHLAEHHSTPLGMAPSPSVFLSAVSQRTTRLRFGPLLYLLPLYEPLRLVEEICMLDQLSNGRFELGVGRGASPFELAYYNVPFLQSKGMFEEAVEVLAKGLRHQRINHRGTHYTYFDAPLELGPVQKPNPPFWFGGFTPGNATFAGSYGMHMVTGGRNKGVGKLASVYHEARAKIRGTERDLNPNVDTPFIGAMRHVYVAETDAEAQATATPAYTVYYNNLMKLWRDFSTVNTLFTPDLAEARQQDAAICGSPETVRADLARYFDESGANYVALAFAWGSLTPEEARRSMDLFASEVMPAFVEP